MHEEVDWNRVERLLLADNDFVIVRSSNLKDQKTVCGIPRPSPRRKSNGKLAMKCVYGGMRQDPPNVHETVIWV